jgi:hypothetical protein
VVFPAIVVYEHAPDRYTIITGNHRHEAAMMAKIPTLDAYVVRTQDRGLIEIMTRTANGLEGWGDSRADAIQNALYLKDKFGLTLKSLAPMCGVPERALRAAHQLKVAKDRLGELQVDTAGLTDTTRSRLGNIRGDRALKGAATLVREAQLTGALLEELVIGLNRERTEDAQMELLQVWDARPEVIAGRGRGERGKRRMQPTRDDKLASLIASLTGHLERNTVGARPDAHQRPVLADKWTKLVRLMDAYLGGEAHETPTGNGVVAAGAGVPR